MRGWSSIIWITAPIDAYDQAKKQNQRIGYPERAIEQRIEEVHGGTPATQQPPPQSVDVIGQIERLAALRDQGVLTEQEFQAKKQDLLSRI